MLPYGAGHATTEVVAFSRMEDGTREEFQLLAGKCAPLLARVPDEAIATLKRLAGNRRGYKIDRFEHSLQTASRAFRDGADEEMVVCALLHDIGDGLAPENHSHLAAAMLRPYISEANYWLILHHGIFQGYYYFHHLGRDRNERDRYRGHPMFERTVAFCRDWDQASFDPKYDTMPLSAFEPILRRILSSPKSGG